jgi:hypothetical protein
VERAALLELQPIKQRLAFARRAQQEIGLDPSGIQHFWTTVVPPGKFLKVARRKAHNASKLGASQVPKAILTTEASRPRSTTAGYTLDPVRQAAIGG